MQVDLFVKHHFSAKCLPRFAIAFPSGVFICTDEPSIQKHHRAQEHSTVPSLHSTMHLSFPFLPTAFECSHSWKLLHFIEDFLPPLPKFLQYIAVIHFSVAEQPIFSAVYTLPSPRTAVCRYTGICLLNFSSGTPSYSWFFHPLSIPWKSVI